MKSRFVRIGVVLLGSLLIASLAHADEDWPSWLPGDTPVSEVGVQGSTMNIDADALFAASASVSYDDNSVTFLDGSMMMASMWEWTWEKIILDPDPSVDFVGDFTNLNAGAQNFVFSIVTPVAPPLPSSLYGGSTSVTIGDTGTNGATLANAPGQPGYAGTIDGGSQLLLLNPFSLSAPPGGTNGKTEWNGMYATIPGPAVNTSIGIVHEFNLTGLDNATFNSTFHVIPELGTFALLASGLCGLALLGRRRQT